MQTLLTPLLSGGKRLGKASFASSDDDFHNDYDDEYDDDCGEAYKKQEVQECTHNDQGKQQKSTVWKMKVMLNDHDFHFSNSRSLIMMMMMSIWLS